MRNTGSGMARWRRERSREQRARQTAAAPTPPPPKGITWVAPWGGRFTYTSIERAERHARNHGGHVEIDGRPLAT